MFSQAGRATPDVDEERMMSNSYVAISTSIFAIVAIVHLARLLKRWPVQVGTYSAPMSVSWFGLLVSALLASWGLMQLGH